jgi:3-oxoadipate enol-lactonase
MTVREIRSGERRFRFVEAPAGAAARPAGTLVLVHAFPLNARMWEPQMELAERGWRVVAPQLRQFDGGDDPAATSIDEYAADVLGLLRLLDVDRAIVAGVSMGGYIALAMFRLAPQSVRGMVLADTRAEADTPEAVENRRRALRLVDEGGPAAVADDMIPKLVGDTTRRTRPEVVARIRALILSSPAQAIAGAIRAMMTRPDSTGLLAAIACPTLVVVGDEDTLTPPSLSENLHRRIAGSELVAIPRAGHLASIEEPRAFNAALARFLDRQA